MAKQELLATIRDRYRESSKKDKGRILDEFIAVTGHRCKHGIRLLGQSGDAGGKLSMIKGRRIYDEAVREAVILAWEATDRICGKRLKAALPHLVESMERHGHLDLDLEVRERLPAASAATLDRLLKPVRSTVSGRRRRRRNLSPGRNIPVLTFADWNRPPCRSPAIMGRKQPRPDTSENPEPPRGGKVVCFGFLTYCLLLMVDQLPPRNGGAAVLETVDTVGDDAAIVASILTSWKVPTRLVSSPVGNDHHGPRVMNHLNAWGVDLEERVSHEITTPVEVGVVDGGGRTYFQRRDASAMAALTPPAPPGCPEPECCTWTGTTARAYLRRWKSPFPVVCSFS